MQGGEGDHALEPGQPGPQAVVNAVAEGQVTGVRPGDVEGFRMAVPRSALRWGHGDGLVLRGLTELPVILRPS